MLYQQGASGSHDAMALLLAPLAPRAVVGPCWRSAAGAAGASAPRPAQRRAMRVRAERGAARSISSRALLPWERRQGADQSQVVIWGLEAAFLRRALFVCCE